MAVSNAYDVLNACAQMVGKLLGQQNQSGSAMLGASVPSVSPGDIGIICFHRAQVKTVRNDSAPEPRLAFPFTSGG